MNFRQFTSLSWFRFATVVSVVVYQIGIFLAYLPLPRGDFSIYFRAAGRVFSNQKIYNFEENLYIYGPLLAHLLSWTSSYSELLISNLWLFLNILLSWVTSVLLLKLINFKLDLYTITFTTGLLSFCFAFRNNAGNGSVMMFVLSSLLYVFLCLTKSRISSLERVLISLSIVFVFETKTYLAIYLFIFLIYLRRLDILISSISTAIVLNFYYLWVGTETYLDWIIELRVRAQSIESGSDQATFLVFIHKLFPNSSALYWFLFFSIIGTIIFISFRTTLYQMQIKDFSLLVMTVAPLCSIFAHGQDFVLSCVVLIAILLKSQGSKNERMGQIFCLALMLNWTNQNILFGFLTSCLILQLLLTIRDINFLEVTTFSTLGTGSLLALNQFGKLEGDLQFQVYNFQALFFAFIVWMLLIQHFFKTNRT